MKQNIELQQLAATAPQLERALNIVSIDSPALFTAVEISRETLWVTMRDGIRLATDLYLPPRLPAPAIAMRTPYGRANAKLIDTFQAFAQRGYVVISQDCRGTGDSEPDTWEYYTHESEDGVDFVEWVSGQRWFNGFLGSLGSSYVGQTQWCMAMHPRMSTIVPEVSGLGIAANTARLYMFFNAYACSVGKGADKLPLAYDELERFMLDETLSGGYFNEPLYVPLSQALLSRYPELQTMTPSDAQRWLWREYGSLPSSGRAEFIKAALGTNRISVVEVEALAAVFGPRIPHDAHTIPNVSTSQLVARLQAPALMITGWYDWALNDALATWSLLAKAAQESVRDRCRLIVTPSAHNEPGYHEGADDHPELQHSHRVTSHPELLMRWYAAVRGQTLETWPRVIYYLMGANEWCCADAWPPREAHVDALYLDADGTLTSEPPRRGTAPDRYMYSPKDPTPTVGGSIVSYVYPPGSVDVSEAQRRADVLTYTTGPLGRNLDVVGPLRLILYASSSALDTDFCGRLSDVFPDGRAIQLQAGILRARHRDITGVAEHLLPGEVYRLEIDLWATANRFKAGHRLRLDISSSDFPKFDRNTNRGGLPGPPLVAEQTVYHDPERPSQLLISVLGQALMELH